MPNKRLGSYEIIEQVGKGGMATVYRAYQPAANRYVAIKMIQKDDLGDQQAIQRFQREARLVARLNHPNILPVYDFDGTHDPPYIVMRYMDGGTLKDVLTKAQLPLHEAAYIVQQIAIGLDYAHKQGIVHRDIKPSNIMFDQQGQVVISDFGIARINTPTDETGEGSITLTGAIVGTPDYMAPEQAMTSDVDHHADIYSLSVIAFYLLTGRLPYISNQPMGVLLMHLNHDIPTASQYNDHLTAAVDAVLARGMAKDPSDRYHTALAFSDDLLDALNTVLPDHPEALIKTIQTLMHDRQIEMLEKDITAVHHAEQNRLVTVLYANADEYQTVLEAQNNRDAARHTTQTLLNTFQTIITSHGGQIFSRGDYAILALWGAEVSREDDPERAIKAALAMQDALKNILNTTDDNILLPLNIGINTGTVLLTPGNRGSYSASGTTINIAKRLTLNAHGLILISHSTYRHVLGVFNARQDESIRLRGQDDVIRVYRVESIKPRPFRRDLRGVEGVETKLIGREAELKHLQDSYYLAIEDQEAQMVSIIGEPGIGKSRLIYEFSNWCDLRPEGYRIFRGRATLEMTSQPYALLHDLLAYRFQLADTDSPALIRAKFENGLANIIAVNDIAQQTEHLKLTAEIAAMVGQLAGYDFSISPYVKGLASDPQQFTTRARQLFIRMIQLILNFQPVVFELEDLHLADDASLDLISEMVEACQDMPLLVTLTARPTLLERRPNWGSGQDYHTWLELKPLSKRDSRNLAREILKQVKHLPKELRDFLVDRCEGNPYYMEELIKLLIEERVIQKFPDEWRVEETRLENIPVPPTLIGLLQARLDGLLFPERVVLQRASIIGRIFWDGAVSAMQTVDHIQIENLDDVLEALIEREFIHRRETSAFSDYAEYIFAQNMLRDQVYDNLLTRQKQGYHKQIADWLVKHAGERTHEYIGIIAQHYELAEEHTQAVVYLSQIGERSLSISAYQEALQFFQRALSLIPESDISTRRRIQVRIAEAHRSLSNYDIAKQILTEALNNADYETEPELTAHILFELSQIYVDEGDLQHAETYLTEGLALARKGDDQQVLASILYGLGDNAWRQGNNPKAQTYLTESLQIAKNIQDNTRALFVLNRLAVLAAVEQNYTEAEALFEECYTLAQQIGNRERAAVALGNLGELAAIHGDYHAARDRITHAVEIAQELNQQYTAVLGMINLANVNLHLEDYSAALQHLQNAIRIAQESNLTTLILGAIIRYAQLCAAQGDIDSALQYLDFVKLHPTSESEVQREVDEVLKTLPSTNRKKQHTSIKLEAILNTILQHAL
ncbi:MAG: hypothetical protein D6711_16490 [Chloroflexi bacterium]|nr:MAG: hypothetical protein D6711_16490 [Chloroflexota bacterium]